MIHSCFGSCKSRDETACEWHCAACEADWRDQISCDEREDAQIGFAVCHLYGSFTKLQLTLSRGDLAASITLLQNPQLEPTLLDPDIATYFKEPSRCTLENAKAFRIRLLNFTDMQDLSDIAANVYWGLRNITELLEGFQAGSENEVLDVKDDDVQYSDRVEVLERATHTLWYNNTKDPSTLVFRLFGSATLIYIYTVLRELPPELRIMKLVALRMKDQMERATDLNVLLATFPELMLWILFLGGQVAETQRKPFFARQASKILIMKKIEAQDDILKASQNFLWPERSVFEKKEDREDKSKSSSGSESSASPSGPPNPDGLDAREAASHGYER